MWNYQRNHTALEKTLYCPRDDRFSRVLDWSRKVNGSITQGGVGCNQSNTSRHGREDQTNERKSFERRWEGPSRDYYWS